MLNGQGRPVGVLDEQVRGRRCPGRGSTPAFVSIRAVMIAVLSPVSCPSSTAAIGKIADCCPAPITTLTGTVAAVLSLLLSEIVMGVLAGLAIETVPVVA